MARIKRTIPTGADSRHAGTERWMVTRDIRPGVESFVLCSSREEALEELGGDVDEDQPWMLRTASGKNAGWRL